MCFLLCSFLALEKQGFLNIDKKSKFVHVTMFKSKVKILIMFCSVTTKKLLISHITYIFNLAVYLFRLYSRDMKVLCSLKSAYQNLCDTIHSLLNFINQEETATASRKRIFPILKAGTIVIVFLILSNRNTEGQLEKFSKKFGKYFKSINNTMVLS